MNDNLSAFSLLANVLSETEPDLANKPWVRVQSTLNDWTAQKIRLWLIQNAPHLPTAQNDTKASMLRRIQLIFLAGKHNFAAQGTSRQTGVMDESADELRVQARPARKRTAGRSGNPGFKRNKLGSPVINGRSSAAILNEMDEDDCSDIIQEFQDPPIMPVDRSNEGRPISRGNLQAARRLPAVIPARLQQGMGPSFSPPTAHLEGEIPIFDSAAGGMLGPPLCNAPVEDALSPAHLFEWLASSEMLADDLLEWRVLNWARTHNQPELISLVHETKAMLTCLKKLPSDAARRVVVGYMSDDQQPQSAFSRFFKFWSKEDKSKLPRRGTGFEVRLPAAAPAKGPPLCFSCRRPGHIQRDCPDRAAIAPRVSQSQ